MRRYGTVFKLFNLVMCVAAALIAGGCQGHWTPAHFPDINKPDVALEPARHASFRGPLVVIRYPARIAAGSEGALRSMWAKLHTVDVGSAIFDDSEAQSRINDSLEETLLETLFYSMELKRCLESRLGDDRVVMQPMELYSTDEVTGMSYVSSSPPAPLVIDFWCRSNGKRLYPLVRMSLMTSPQEPHNRLVFTNFDSADKDGDERAPFHSWLATRHHGGLAREGMRTKRPANATTPLLLRFSAQVWTDELPSVQDAAKRPFEPYWTLWANIAAEILNDPASDEASRWALHDYASVIDTRWPKDINGVLPERLALVAKFLDAERRFLVDIDNDLIQKTYYSALGTSVRELRFAENAHNESVAAARESASTAGMIAMLGAASTFYAQGTGAISTSQATSNIMQLNIYNSQVQASTDATVRELQREYAMYMDRVLPEAVEVKIQLDEGDETLRVSSLKELREKFRIIYARKFGNQ